MLTESLERLVGGRRIYPVHIIGLYRSASCDDILMPLAGCCIKPQESPLAE